MEPGVYPWHSWRRRWMRVVGGSLVALVVLAALILCYMWFADVISFELDRSGEEVAGVLLGTATITLTVVAIVVAFISFYGWVSIRGKVEDEVSRALEGERRFDLALSRHMMGAMYSFIAEYIEVVAAEAKRLSEKQGIDTSTLDWQLLGPDRFIEASIHWSSRALKLEDADDWRDVAWKTKNNLALCLARRRDAKPEDGRTAVRLIKETIADERRSGEYEAAVKLTLCRVMARFAHLEEAPKRELEKAKRWLDEAWDELQSGTPDTRREAKELNRLLEQAIAKSKQATEPEESVGELMRRLWRRFWRASSDG